MSAQIYAATKEPDYDVVDPSYDDAPDPDYDDVAQAGGNEGTDPDYGTDYADPDSGDAGSQEYRKRSQK